MDAHADFDFIIRKGKAGLAYAGQNAGRHRHAHRAHVIDRLLRNCLDFGKGLAGFRRRTRKLMYEYRARDAAPSGGIGAVLNRHIIANDYIIGLDAILRRNFAGHGEIHNITGVILDDHQNARAAIRRLDALNDAIRRGGRKYVARDRRIQHAVAHIARVRRFMAAAAAGDHADLAVLLMLSRDHLNAFAEVNHIGIRHRQTF